MQSSVHGAEDCFDNCNNDKNCLNISLRVPPALKAMPHRGNKADEFSLPTK